MSIGPGTDTFKIRCPSFGSREIGFLIEDLRCTKGSEGVHGLMSDITDRYEKVSYFRFNVPGLEDVPFDEWTVKKREKCIHVGKMHTMDFIERQTIHYLREDKTRTELRPCAQTLVNCYCPIYESTRLGFSWVGDSHPPLT